MVGQKWPKLLLDFFRVKQCFFVQQMDMMISWRKKESEMLALFDFEYKFIFIETMNTQTIPHYIDSHEETDSIEVR